MGRVTARPAERPGAGEGSRSIPLEHAARAGSAQRSSLSRIPAAPPRRPFHGLFRVAIFSEPIREAERYLTGVVTMARPEALVAVASGASAGRVEGLDFEALYAKHARYVAGVVHRLMGDDGELDDIVQETFVDAIEGLARLVDPSATRAWLVTVAVRRTRRVLARRRRRMMFAFWSADFAPRCSDPKDRAAVDDLYDALARVPEDLRIP
ncbi:MAG TPA: sigma-70 family RNA polymerase sigma factor, partial [Labilithrix sp.]|nr:sigma-70 family RNA polymerase sigma factor [Labilithrix sp.]